MVSTNYIFDRRRHSDKHHATKRLCLWLSCGIGRVCKYDLSFWPYSRLEDIVVITGPGGQYVIVK